MAEESQRDPMTAHFYPDEMSVEEFIDEITNPVDNQNFIANMRHLQERGSRSMPVKRYPEDWIETYAAWKEMNK